MESQPLLHRASGGGVNDGTQKKVHSNIWQKRTLGAGKMAHLAKYVPTQKHEDPSQIQSVHVTSVWACWPAALANMVLFRFSETAVS